MDTNTSPSRNVRSRIPSCRPKAFYAVFAICRTAENIGKHTCMCTGKHSEIQAIGQKNVFKSPLLEVGYVNARTIYIWSFKRGTIKDSGNSYAEIGSSH